MQITKYYTGNPMLNNALMTIKTLAGLTCISDLTTDILKNMLMKVCDQLPYSLLDLNMRFKSYTMLFTKNGPLYNDKKLGKQIYQNLMLKIVSGFENEGDKTCDISGFKYTRSFSEFLSEVLIELGVPAKEVSKKDLTLNRCWFPLLGGLGSDAQALPMAKYTYNVHPIFIVILQFLPFSARLYKKGILLVDSMNMEFCEYYVEKNVYDVLSVAKATSVSEQIDNIKDFTKGNYILRALEILKEAEVDYDCPDINLWSFSNSGTGANCEIDRVPNAFLLRLQKLYVRHRKELEHILKNVSANKFLENLDACTDWFGLYPTKDYEGVSVEFSESYWEVTGKKQETEIAKYIAYLISKYQSAAFKKYLGESNAWNVQNYREDLKAVLLKATENGEWSFEYQLYIQDNKEALPILFASYNLHKIIHFYYQKETFLNKLPEIEIVQNRSALFCRWMIRLIDKETEVEQIRIKKRICNNECDRLTLNELFIRHCDELDIDIYTLFPILYNMQGYENIFGLCSILRFYYVAPENLRLPITNNTCALPKIDLPRDYRQWFEDIDRFVLAYIQYRLKGVVNEEKKAEAVAKILKSIPKNDLREQRVWLNVIIRRLNDFDKEVTWDEDLLVYNPIGNYSFVTFMFAFRMKMTKMMYKFQAIK